MAKQREGPVCTPELPWSPCGIDSGLRSKGLTLHGPHCGREQDDLEPEPAG